MISKQIKSTILTDNKWTLEPFLTTVLEASAQDPAAVQNPLKTLIKVQVPGPYIIRTKVESLKPGLWTLHFNKSSISSHTKVRQLQHCLELWGAPLKKRTAIQNQRINHSSTRKRVLTLLQSRLRTTPGRGEPRDWEAGGLDQKLNTSLRALMRRLSSQKANNVIFNTVFQKLRIH